MADSIALITDTSSLEPASHRSDLGASQWLESPRPERRKPPPEPAALAVGRAKLAVRFLLEQIDEWGDVVADESAVSEDVGLDGAHLRSWRAFRRGVLLTVREPGGGFETTARVVECAPLPDGSRRLAVEFLGQGPAHLLGGL